MTVIIGRSVFILRPFHDGITLSLFEEKNSGKRSSLKGHFIEGSNFNRGQKYFSGGQKYFIEGSNFIGGQKYFIWGPKILQWGSYFKRDQIFYREESKILY